LKNEKIDSEIDRIANDELNLELKSKPKILGVFKRFY
jgi:hypothetical protein